MTKNEKILFSLNRVNSLDRPVFELASNNGTTSLIRPQMHVPYKNPEEIFKLEPNCCHIYSRYTAETNHPLEKLPSNDEGVVSVRYWGQYTDKDGSLKKAAIVMFDDLNSCKK